jgi:MSHA biogenesis protein MshK
VFRAAAALALSLAAAAAPAAEPVVRDPMRPFTAESAARAAAADAAPRFELTAVLIGSDRRVAIINGNAHLLGDSVGGVRIVAIDSDSVRLEGADGEVVVPLGRGKAEQPDVQGETAP